MGGLRLMEGVGYSCCEFGGFGGSGWVNQLEPNIL
jgi:hypothetical protein